MEKVRREPVLLFRLAVLLAAGTVLSAPLGAQAQAMEAEGQVISSAEDIVLNPPERASSFRFVPGKDFIPFDRNLVLSAAPGERRSYLLQINGSQSVVTYYIDKRRPPAPSSQPGSGIYYDAIAPKLQAGDASVFWNLVGPDVQGSIFKKFGPNLPPLLKPPASGTATYTLIAYSVDGLGNRSYPATFVYRLAESGLPAEAPQPAAETPLLSSYSLPQPDFAYRQGSTELRMPLPAGASLLVCMDTESAPTSLDDFEEIEGSGGVASFRLECPYGWSGELGLYYGILDAAGNASYSAKPLSVRLAYQADAPLAPASPDPPQLAADPAGRASYIAFPAYAGDIFVAIDLGEPKPYSSPILMPQGKREARVTWYGKDYAGRSSETKTLDFSLPRIVPDIELKGVENGALTSSGVSLKPNAPGLLRYELRTDGSVPPEPTSSSPVVGDRLDIPCPEGQDLSVVLRYRAFSDPSAGEGRTLRFRMDRKPPEPPRVRDAMPDYIDHPVSLVILPGAEAASTYASVSIDGAEAPFQAVSGPLELRGNDSGPTRYTVRAYDLDTAGNRSEEMPSLSFVVDSYSVYVADDAESWGQGSQAKPYKNLGEAIAAAIKAGKRNVNARGNFSLRSPLVCANDLRIAGGYSKDWMKGSGDPVSIALDPPRGSSAFVQTAGSLILDHVDLVAADSSSAPLFSISGASLSLQDAAIRAEGSGDLVLVSSKSSRLRVADSRLSLDKGLSCTAFAVEGGSLELRSSSVEASSEVRYFSAFDLRGSQLSLRESLVKSDADLGLNMISLRSSSMLIDRCLLQAEGGSGFLRIAALDTVSGEMRNSKVLASWKGQGTLFESRGSDLAFRHDTILADCSAGGLRFFDAKGSPPRIWNSIADSSSPGSEFLRCDSRPGAGVLVADCLWGFDLLLAGAVEERRIEGLNAINKGSSLYSTRPIITESPSRTFESSAKAPASLSAASACVDSALVLGEAYATDFNGRPRPTTAAGFPDIGADEVAR
jgi:hypothetical protein